MKVLMISLDKRILIEGSASQRRMIDYGRLVDELYIIIVGGQRRQFKLTDRVFVYATGRGWRPGYLWRLGRLGRLIIRQAGFEPEKDLITVQDPILAISGYWLKKVV